MKFRDYQSSIINKGTEILEDHGLLYLAMEVRTGKTLTSLGICEMVGAERVLFITKKKAISSIRSDYKMLNPSFDIEIINYESVHKIDYIFKPDVIIADEAHSMGAFPKPSKRAKDLAFNLKQWGSHLILMSGTPTPESYSQIYHQVYGHKNTPFKRYENFYRWANVYVSKKPKYLGTHTGTDYSDASRDIILKEMKPYTINYTQREAGFKSTIDEEILTVKMKPSTYELCSRLKRDRVIEGNEEVILADTGVKLMGKLHQMYSGTVIFESGESGILDLSKAEFIKERFKSKKIGIFYKFKQELKALKQVFGDQLVTELVDFDNNPDANIALQIVSGREGISLRKADHIVYYNIDFSATSYWQSRDRMTTKDRLYNKIYWVFAEGGIEQKIYRAVNQKKDYTLKHFKNDFNT
jgi:hypothetical protein